MNQEEAKKWLKKNWAKLVDNGKLSDALRRYYKLANKTAGEAWSDVKEMASDE